VLRVVFEWLDSFKTNEGSGIRQEKRNFLRGWVLPFSPCEGFAQLKGRDSLN
jgi:hypothetical protein